MNIKNITINNFKCFDDKTIDFSVPNGNPGSGLTILIGENGSGKTTVLEAIDYLAQGTYIVENKLDINNFREYKSPIIIEAKTSDFVCSSGIGFYKDWTFNCSGIHFESKSRERKSPGKLLSSPYEVSKKFVPITNYIKPDGTRSKEVDPRDLAFSNTLIKDDELNVFYFDKNRTRQISAGNYTTTLERILDDLNWKFRKEISPADEKSLLDNVSGEYFRTVESVLGSSPGSNLGAQLKDFFDNEEYSNLKIDFVNLLSPYTNAEFSLRKDKELTQRHTRNLGSGVEMILTILMLRLISNASKGSIVYLIDEPELHLHPKAQEKLLELLVKEAADKQVILSTHSPYMFQGIFSTEASLYIAAGPDDSFSFVNAAETGWGLFGENSPTWGEINFFAYKMASIEFHNELYGFLQSKATDEDSKNEKCEEFDKYLGCPINLDWIHEKSNGDITYKVTLQTYIRNRIHHPENTKNVNFTPVQLKESTEKLIEILRQKL